MKNIAIFGVQQGDEAKSRMVHHFAPQYDVVVRPSASGNCGHTVYRNGKKYVHHLVPCVDWRTPHTKAFLGSDMVVNLKELLEEILLFQQDFPEIAKRIIVDPEAFLVSSEHIALDKKNNAHIGSTNKGVQPAYSDKMARKGLRIRDALTNTNVEGYTEAQQLKQLGVQFKYILEMQEQFQNSKIIFEGAQSILLDLNHGMYPYVSCGNAGLGGLHASGFGNIKLDRVYGVLKCYNTKSGNGPFPTQITGDKEEELRNLGLEIGATTGRNRKIGWLDLPALRYSVNKGCITDLIISKFDVLDGQKEVPVCNEYEKEPVSSGDFFDAVPKYISMKGWNNSKEYPTLNSNIINFIELIEKSVQRPVRYITVGLSENDMHEYNSTFKPTEK